MRITAIKSQTTQFQNTHNTTKTKTLPLLSIHLSSIRQLDSRDHLENQLKHKFTHTDTHTDTHTHIYTLSHSQTLSSLQFGYSEPVESTQTIILSLSLSLSLSFYL